MIRLWVEGNPAPQGSKRQSRHGHLYEASKKVRPWRDRITAESVTHGHTGLLLTGPLAVTITFLFARPAAHYGTGRNRLVLRNGAPLFPASTNGPDIDKLCRSTFDGLVDARIILDDGLIVSLTTNKEYSDDGRNGAIIEVSLK